MLLHPESWHETLPICSRRHLSSKLIFFTPISADEIRCHFRLRVLANHFASIFFLSFSGDSLGLLSLSLGHRVQTSVDFHSDLDLLLRPQGIDLDYYFSLNGHSLGGLLIQTWRGRGHSLSLSSLNGRPRDNTYGDKSSSPIRKPAEALLQRRSQHLIRRWLLVIMIVKPFFIEEPFQMLIVLSTPVSDCAKM